MSLTITTLAEVGVSMAVNARPRSNGILMVPKKVLWKIIEPRYEKEKLISRTTRICAFSGIKNGKEFFWSKTTEDKGGMFAPPKSPDELTESERIADELIDLLRQESISDEELKRKTNALQQVRENASAISS